MKAKKLILTNLPYVLIGLACTNLGEAWRMAEGGNASEKLLSLIGTIPAAFGNPLPSFNALDLCVGLVCGLFLRLAVYLRSKNAKKYRHNIEYGAARFGTAEDIRDKERIVLQIMADNPGKVSYINVRVPDRPTWRAV